MERNFLTEKKAEEIVNNFMLIEGTPVSTQAIINSGEFPELNGFVVRHGKVSDCIFGGSGDFVIPENEIERYAYELEGLDASFKHFIDPEDNKPKFRISFINPPLMTKDGLPLIIMVRTGRISTHDIERGSIPFKGQILAMNHQFMLELVKPFIGTSQFNIGLPDSSIVIAAEKVEGIDFENVIRAYMAKSSTVTSLYHTYIIRKGRTFAGHDLPDDLYPNGPLPFIMDTPSTKSDLHDETVSPIELFERRICTPAQYFALRNNSLAAFGAASSTLRSRGIILADTKKEHGINSKGQIVSKDEMLTMDSSRYWLLTDYHYQQNLYTLGRENELADYLKFNQPGIKEKDYTVNGRVVMVPRSYSKEFARGFSVADQKYTDEQRAAIAVRYIMGIQHLLDRPFVPDMRPWEDCVISGIEAALDQLV